MNTTPVSLLQRLQQPVAAEVWPRFVALYAPLLLGWARRLGLQDADAADLVQDVFTLLLHKLPAFHCDPRQSFRAWLRTLLLNQWRDRCKQRAPDAPGGPGGDLNFVAAPEDDLSPLEETALTELHCDFKPERDAAILRSIKTLRTINGKPAAEVLK